MFRLKNAHVAGIILSGGGGVPSASSNISLLCFFFLCVCVFEVIMSRISVLHLLQSVYEEDLRPAADLVELGVPILGVSRTDSSQFEKMLLCF
jgi:hypothetical protein